MIRNFSRLLLALTALISWVIGARSVGQIVGAAARFLEPLSAQDPTDLRPLIAAPAALVHAVIEDVESYASFMPYTAECRVLKRDGDSVVVYQRISAPLTSDRDYTVRVRSNSKTTDGRKVYSSHWETENAIGPPEKSGVVRVKLCEGSWLLEPTGPNTTRATYIIYTDSGGMIPTFIKNTGSQIGFRKMFAALRKQVRDPKYAKKN